MGKAWDDKSADPRHGPIRSPTCRKCGLEVEIELLAETLPIAFRPHETKQRCKFAGERGHGSNCPHRDEAVQAVHRHGRAA